ncbi:hypothetical protein SAMD00019534_096010 [Acytostelium subglobosum LB1]|uniref:hypothetical protein n=1 Tax=Acytostelium subglobosum LB1 TaxID=1410327 RepID=UPI0006449FFB|nr:hypothetical protein SAMD00019534_096010 [Acytostelium subglobosum LB1]GAM26426.1 hypothetical protein SAMD00019534_096010 [Acytostelium subglobosum LB1]|eukprot:XP_012750522.1 hypothetical protein SAMD00019534_096010 [Acytostelium subglobosum LB1]
MEAHSEDSNNKAESAVAPSTSWFQNFWKKLTKPEMLKLIQAVSGGVIATYYECHLISLIGAHWGPEAFDGLLAFFRPFYQSRWFEPLLVGAVLTHLTVSGAEFIRVIKNKEELYDKVEPKSKMPSPWGLNQISSHLMAGGIFVHTSATRLPRLWLPTYAANFRLVHSTLVDFPYIFYPYYTMLSSMMFYHFIYSNYLISRRYLLGRNDHKTHSLRNKTLWYSIMASGVGMSVSIVMAFGGHYYRVRN